MTTKARKTSKTPAKLSPQQRSWLTRRKLNPKKWGKAAA